MKLNHQKWLVYGALTLAALTYGQMTKAAEINNLFKIESCQLKISPSSNSGKVCFIGSNTDKIVAIGCVNTESTTGWDSAVNARLGDSFTLTIRENMFGKSSTTIILETLVTNKDIPVATIPCIAKKFIDSDTAFLTEGK